MNESKTEEVLNKLPDFSVNIVGEYDDRVIFEFPESLSVLECNEKLCFGFININKDSDIYLVFNFKLDSEGDLSNSEIKDYIFYIQELVDNIHYLNFDEKSKELKAAIYQKYNQDSDLYLVKFKYFLFRLLVKNSKTIEFVKRFLKFQKKFKKLDTLTNLQLASVGKNSSNNLMNISYPIITILNEFLDKNTIPILFLLTKEEYEERIRFIETKEVNEDVEFQSQEILRPNKKLYSKEDEKLIKNIEGQLLSNKFITNFEDNVLYLLNSGRNLRSLLDFQEGDEIDYLSPEGKVEKIKIDNIKFNNIIEFTYLSGFFNNYNFPEPITNFLIKYLKARKNANNRSRSRDYHETE